MFSNPSSTDVTIKVFSSDASAVGEYVCITYITNTVQFIYAGGGIDYRSGPYNVTFPAGVIHVQFNVSIINDDILENIENFILNIDTFSLPNNVTVGNLNQTTIFIVDNDGMYLHSYIAKCIHVYYLGF